MNIPLQNQVMGVHSYTLIPSALLMLINQIEENRTT